MNIETLRSFCLSLPEVKEDVKWGNDLCFLIRKKMFCVTALGSPLQFSIKVTDEDFEELTSMPGIIPAPYLARYKWILIQQPERLPDEKLEHYLRQSYELIKSKLPKTKTSAPPPPEGELGADRGKSGNFDIHFKSIQE